jgi:hypothetical protein
VAEREAVVALWNHALHVRVLSRQPAPARTVERGSPPPGTHAFLPRAVGPHVLTIALRGKGVRDSDTFQFGTVV